MIISVLHQQVTEWSTSCCKHLVAGGCPHFGSLRGAPSCRSVLLPWSPWSSIGIQTWEAWPPSNRWYDWTGPHDLWELNGGTTPLTPFFSPWWTSFPWLSPYPYSAHSLWQWISCLSLLCILSGNPSKGSDRLPLQCHGVSFCPLGVQAYVRWGFITTETLWHW